MKTASKFLTCILAIVFITGIVPGVLAANTYHITATAGSGGIVTGGGIFEEGDTVTLTATPDTGYDFIGWYEDGIRNNNSTATYSFIVEESRTLEARFMEQIGSETPVYIMATAGLGGTITGGGMYFYGNTVTLTATPNNGFHFIGWYEDDIRINNAGAIYSFVAEEFRTLEARFMLSGSEMPVYIMATAGTGGTITGDGIYHYGDVVYLTAIPDPEYYFIGWYEDDVKINGAGNIYSFGAEEFRMLEVRFRRIPTLPLFIKGLAGSGGTATGSGVCFYGDTVTLVAMPSTGFVFDGWYENDVKINGAGATYSFIAENDRLLEARFTSTANHIDVKSNEYVINEISYNANQPNANLIIALYNDSKLAGMKIIEPINGNGTVDTTIIEWINSEQKDFKVMMWDSMNNMKPLCPAKTMEYENDGWVMVD